MLDGWNLSDKIAAIAIVVAFLQFAGLIATIYISIRNSRRELRAYVFVENAWAKQKKNSSAWEITYKIKNCGQTPLRGLTVEQAGKYVDWPIMNMPTFDETNKLGSMAPSGDFIDNWAREIMGVSIDDIKEERKGFCLVGKLNYIDAFNNKRWTTFCFTATGEMPEDGEMEVHENGNDYY